MKLFHLVYDRGGLAQGYALSSLVYLYFGLWSWRSVFSSQTRAVRLAISNCYSLQWSLLRALCLFLFRTTFTIPLALTLG